MMKATILAGVAAQVSADCYLHMPKGSNNRLNEKSANRNNGNRLFDSQNNNRGGYNKGDSATDAFGGNSQSTMVFAGEYADGQYSEVYFEKSTLPIEWTAQHGCGGNEKDDPHKLNCNMVIQYTCNTVDSGAAEPDYAEKIVLMDGRNTQTPGDTNTFGNIANQNNDNNGAGRGRNEHEGWYYQCQHRKQAKGLFHADQKLKGDTSKYTRQNPNGNRRGLECPEERDYYPYWHPTPWIDVAYLTDTPEDCKAADAEGSFGVQDYSQNVMEKWKCTKTTNDDNEMKKIMNVLTEKECTDEGGTWKGYKHDVPAPDCRQGQWSRVNHLGNGRDGQPLMYNWTLPAMDKLGAAVAVKDNVAKCVLRVRYNISTDDYDPRTTNSSHDYKPGYPSPVTQNPTVDIGLNNLQGLRLAINTAQFGRTFQDRSHSFYIKKRPNLAGVPSGKNFNTGKVRNLQVRGKRGNIVQTFPSVEYDFMPNYLHMAKEEFIHLQWTGSNTHNNGNPAGDGQAGDAGEGTGGTDRQNLLPLVGRGANFPLPYGVKVEDTKVAALSDAEKGTGNFFNSFDCWAPQTQSEQARAQYDNNYMKENQYVMLTQENCAVWLATGGYIKKETQITQLTGDNALNPTLDNAPASLHGGLILSPKVDGEFHYMNTRNNNFSNRSQKGTVIVTSAKTAATAWGDK